MSGVLRRSKGVLPATDEVERVKIGYEPTYNEPLIVINDRNENECVALSVDLEGGDGKVLLSHPCGDRCTGIDSGGLEVFDGDWNTLAECAAPEDAKDRPVLAEATEPTTT